MRVANIIVAHKNPEQLRDLVQQYPADLFHTWIHIDRRKSLQEFKTVLRLPGVSVLEPRVKLHWTGYGFVQVMIDGMCAIRDSGEKFAYVNLMSGQDFPVRPVAEFYDLLQSSFQSTRHEFFDILPVDEDWPARHRYEGYHFPWITTRGRYFLERMVNTMLPVRKFYSDRLVPFGRSSWFTATTEFSEFALRYLEDHPGYLRFLRTVWSPDEFLLNSLIMASPFKDRLFGNHLRYIHWIEGEAHPKTLTMNEYDAITKSGMYLARKFDPGVDNTVIGKFRSIAQKK